MSWGDENKRRVFPSVDRSLPLFVETIGYSAWELLFHRPDGYPYYHWLYTLRGEGILELEGAQIALTAGKGALLTPFTPHAYYPVAYDRRWSTTYVTFGGEAASAILDSLGMNVSAVYTETQISFAEIIGEAIDMADRDAVFPGLEVSTGLYRFLMLLRQFGMRNDRPSLSQFYDKLRPVVQWMEQHLADNIGLPEIAGQAQLSVSYLNELFHDAFGMSPYSYLIHLRIREAKRIMMTSPGLPLRDVAVQAGFNDVSHFVATFRKKEGLTPAKYRDLHLTSPPSP